MGAAKTTAGEKAKPEATLVEGTTSSREKGNLSLKDGRTKHRKGRQGEQRNGKQNNHLVRKREDKRAGVGRRKNISEPPPASRVGKCRIPDRKNKCRLELRDGTARKKKRGLELRSSGGSFDQSKGTFPGGPPGVREIDP